VAGENGAATAALGLVFQPLHRRDIIICDPLYAWVGDVDEDNAECHALEFQLLVVFVRIERLDRYDDYEDGDKKDILERVALCDFLRLWGAEWPGLHEAVMEVARTFPVETFRRRLTAYMAEFVQNKRVMHISVSGHGAGCLSS